MITSDKPIVFVDTETTGLDPRLHEIWELALIVRRPDQPELELLFQFWPEHLAMADAQSLGFNRFWDRVLVGPNAAGWGLVQMAEIEEPDRAVPKVKEIDFPQQLGRDLSRLLAGAHLVAANPSFDEPMLNKLLTERLGVAVQPWNYHLLDIEAMAIGWLVGMHVNSDEQLGLDLPFKSGRLAEMCGVKRDPASAHTALADARWVRDWFDTITA